MLTRQIRMPVNPQVLIKYPAIRAVRAGVLEKECQKLEKRAVRAEQKAHKTEEMYRQAQFKVQNTEDSFNQLMHMHRQALAQLENAKDSISSLKVDLNEARNGDWYFWDFVGELRCGICNQDLDGAYSLTCGDTFHGSGSKRLSENTWSTRP
ncbi:uncharacterized protein ARMOST_17559 [Armillaria ostoyae]|uniref:Uncharacterized protein n=1 Tax=Armillaria ostoyae TaxID=47428 RepID=A0A284RZB4_ARMOS|nr:uncharacterized protein ARMOST_17559 [Armillaria ostoyae]